MTRGYLVLDIETIPDTTLWTRPEEPPTGRSRDAGFPPTYAHRIICVGCMLLDSNYQLLKLGVIGEGPQGENDECGILEDFTSYVDRDRPILVTYNGRTFDMPVIALRALRHGVPLGWYYQERGVRYRYSEEGHIDVCDWLSDHGATRSGSLDAFAKLIGLPGKVGVDGSQIEGLYRGGQISAIENYCLADVAQTALLFLRFRLLQGVLTRDTYRTAAADLTTQLRADTRLAEFMRAVDGDRLLMAA